MDGLKSYGVESLDGLSLADRVCSLQSPSGAVLHGPALGRPALRHSAALLQVQRHPPQVLHESETDRVPARPVRQGRHQGLERLASQRAAPRRLPRPAVQARESRGHRGPGPRERALLLRGRQQSPWRAPARGDCGQGRRLARDAESAARYCSTHQPPWASSPASQKSRRCRSS